MEKLSAPKKYETPAATDRCRRQVNLPLRIRTATLGDVEPMTALLRHLFALEPDFIFDPCKQRQGLARLICREHGRCVLVAETGMRVIGMCTVQTVISTAEGGPVGWVEDVVVDPNYRGRSVGRNLLITLESWAKSEGLKRLQLIADRDNAPALGFYERLGWTPTRMVVLRKML